VACVFVVAASAYLVGSAGRRPAGSAVTSAGEETAERGLKVIGNAVVRTRPDFAIITVSCVTRDPKAAPAYRSNQDKVERVVAVLEAEGLAEEDLQTSACSLEPYYNPNGALKGYKASHSLTVKVRDLAKVASVLDQVAAVGAAGVGAGTSHWTPVQFGVNDLKPLRQTARDMAVKNAQERAAQIAEGLGRSLGRVVSAEETTESQGYYPGHFQTVISQAQVGWQPPAGEPEEERNVTGISPGLVAVTASVEVTFELR
jgi:uncharacterized protein YggE